MMVIAVCLLWMPFTMRSQDIRTITLNVDGRAYGGCPGPIDEFTITGAAGIEWIKVTDNFMGDDWENDRGILYDGVPVVGATVVAPKGPPPCEGCDWKYVRNLYVVALGEGTLTMRVRRLGQPPYPTEGEFIERTDPDGRVGGSGSVIVSPANVQPGATVNIRINIPARFRQHIGELILFIPTGPASLSKPPQRVTLPFQIDGVYDYTWRVPMDILGPSTNPDHRISIRFEAYSSRPNASGGFNRLTSGSTILNVASTLSVRIGIQGRSVPLGSTNEWNDQREREIFGAIDGGREPFETRWFINGEEVTATPMYMPAQRQRKLANQNVLADAATITFEATDANGNSASGTVYVGIKTDLDFEYSVQGHVVESGEKVKWKETSSKMVTARILRGRMPLKTQWLINGEESMSSTLVNARHAQFTDREILEKASSVTLIVTDANDVQVRKTVYFEDAEVEDDTADQVPAEPVGPAPTPPPLSGPNWEPNPDVEWNNRPWLDERVQQCTREYLQNIVFYMENEYIRWENTALPDNKKRPMWTSIDDWGRILNQYMSTSGGVDGNWDNPTHFVWSEYNKLSASNRYGRTVEYYVKYECGLLEPSGDDLTDAIDDLTDDEENGQWDAQRVQEALNNLDDLLEQARTLYRQFNANYDKFMDEINDQRTNPTQNEMVAFCLASAQNQFDDHGITRDSLDVLGSGLIGQSATNPDIDMYQIINVLSEVEGQAGDMTSKLSEMKALLATYGGDIDEIMQNGQQIAQEGVDPEFVQDGGVNVELFGDGMDNIGDGLQDYLYGNVRRGNVLIILDDVGNVDDDIFEVSIEGRGRLGETPPGGRQHFDISLNPGQYRLTIRGLYSNPGDPNCTYGIQVYDQDELILDEADIVIINEETYYYITIR